MTSYVFANELLKKVFGDLRGAARGTATVDAVERESLGSRIRREAWSVEDACIARL